MSFTATYKTELPFTDDSPGIAGLSTSRLIYDAYNTAISLGPTSTPVISKIAVFTVTLAAGAATIDLRSLTHNGVAAAVDFNGLKLQVMKIRNTATTFVTASKGASNGYALDGTAAWTLPIPPKSANNDPGEWTFFSSEATPDVDSTHKTIDLAGSGTETLQVVLGAG